MINITILLLFQIIGLAYSQTTSKVQIIKAKPYLDASMTKFGGLIEGVGVNSMGQLFAVNYGTSTQTHQLGQFYPNQKLFYTDPTPKALLNGIRFINSTTALTIDAVNHKVIRLDIDKDGLALKSSVWCESNDILQPNDLALTKNGIVYLSGMKYLSETKVGDGDVWVCKPGSKPKRLDLMGRTNGIELSFNNEILYVSEAFNQNSNPYIQKIWKYKVDIETGELSDKLLFADFQKLDKSGMYDIDGMRTDVHGNLYVTRYGQSQVTVLNPKGEIILKIELSFKNPSNLEFGGEDGNTLFIVGKCNEPKEGSNKDSRGCVDMVKMKVPGSAWYSLQNTKDKCY